MSEELQSTHHASLLRRLHQTSRAIAAAGNEATVGQALMDFAASGDLHAARLLLFSDFENGQPSTLEMREGWTVDERPAQPYGTQLPLGSYPLLEFLDANTTVVCENIDTDERVNELVHQMMTLSGLGSFAVIPLTTGRRYAGAEQEGELTQVWLGALVVGRNAPSSYGEELLYAWWTLAGQAASAIENARLFAQTQAALSETAALYDASRHLTAADNMQDMLAIIAESVPMPAINRIVFWTLEYDADDQATALVSAANWYSGQGTPPMPVGQRFPLEQFPNVQLVLSTEPVFSQDLETDEALDLPTRQMFQGQDVRSVALLPLWLGQRQLGTLMLVGEQPHDFSEDEMRPYRSLAGQMAILLENRRLLEQARRSEIRFRDVALSSGDWIWELDTHGRYTYCSESIVDVMGYTAAEIIGHRPIDFIPPDERESVAEAFVEIAASKQPFTDMENLTLTKDGREIVLLINGVPMLDENEDLLGYRGIGRDITALKQRDMELATVMEASKAVLSTLDLEAVLLLIAEEMVRAVRVDGCTLSRWDQESDAVITWVEWRHDWSERRDESGDSYALDDFPATRAVLETHQPAVVHISDPNADRAEVAYMQEKEISSLFMLPLSIGERVIGLVELDHEREERDFTPDQMRLCQVLADQAAIAIENARLFEQTQSALAESEILYNASRRLTEAETLQEMVAAVAEGVRAPGVNRAVVWIIEPGQTETEAVFVAVANWHSGAESPSLPLGTRFPLSLFPAIQMALSTEPAFFDDILQDERVDPMTRTVFQQQNAQATALFPLWVGERQLGTLMLVGGQPHHFNESEMRPFRSLAGQMAVLVENHRLLEQTQKSETRFRDVTLSSGNWVWETDAQGRYSYCSGRVADLLDYAPEEVLGKMPTDLMHPDDVAHVRKILFELMSKKQPIVELETCNLTRDGREVVLLTDGVPILDEDENLLGYRGVSKDITAQKHAEAEREHLLAALERRNTQLQTAAEVSHAASSILGLDELIQQTVDLVRERFDLYYAGLFLVEQGEAGEWAVLQAGTGEAGQKMVEGEHKLKVGGESMIGWCVANKQARIALDVGTEAVRFDNPHLPETRSEMALPLISWGQAIGAMTFQSTQEAAFSDEDVATLQTMSDQLAAAIDNARLYDAARARAEEMAALNDLAQALTACVTTPSVLDEVSRGVSRLLGASDFFVTLYDPEMDDVAFALMHLDGERVPGSALPTSDSRGGLTDHLIRTRQPLLIRGDISKRVAELGLKPIAAKSGRFSACWLGVPMLAGDQVVGTMTAMHYDDPHAYDEHSQELLTAIASQAAIALQNTRLFERSQARAKQERLVRTITDRVRRSADREAILRTTLQELGQMLGASRSVIRLGTPDQLPGAPAPAEEHSTEG
jgi:PAS domain S-box-containing protein